MRRMLTRRVNVVRIVRARNWYAVCIVNVVTNVSTKRGNRIMGSKPKGKVRRAILKQDSKCVYCRVRFSTEVDHILPRARGGSNSWFNLVGSCAKCNRAKRDRTPKEAGLTMRLPIRFFYPRPEIVEIETRGTPVPGSSVSVLPPPDKRAIPAGIVPA